ncbi:MULTISPECIES: flagellar protein FlaG [Aeromonas]|uniref:flagellar protein FlaG n=1 Tax=Aeromonas TaxID=642 RepID=UPI000F95EB2C|nr:flagellar protein FlaG [Aeromonas rivipollensis]
MPTDIVTVSPAAAPLAGPRSAEYGGQQTAIGVSGAPPIAAQKNRILVSQGAAITHGVAPTVAPRTQLVEATPSVAQVAAETQREQTKQEQAQKLLESLRALRDVKGWELDFTLSEATDDLVVQVLDSKTQTLIRQIPSEEMLVLRQRLKDTEHGRLGLLFEQQV